MAPLDAMDIAVRSFNVTVLLLIVILNIRERANPRSPLSAYLWREQPFLTEFGLAYLGVIIALSAIDLGIHFGWLPGGASGVALPLLGIPLACMTLVILVLGIPAAYRGWVVFSARRSGGSDARHG